MSRRSRPAGVALSPEAIVALAIEHADARGVEQLSMRRLAAELGVTPMALYWHFANRDALLDAMAEHVAGQLVYDDDPGAQWQERLRGVLTAILGLLQEHPWLGPLVRQRIVPAPNFLGALEVLLDTVRAAGYGPKAAVAVLDFAIDGLAAMATALPAAPSQGAKPRPASQTQLEMRRQLLELDRTEYPRIREAATPLTTSETPAVQVKVGIDILVGGIEAAVPKKRGR